MKDPYECPRCGYKTSHKPSMRKHLFETKKDCPTTKSMVALTEEIKHHILMYRKYIIERANEQTINQTINNYNTVYNYIAGMDAVKKISKLIDYKQTNLIDFEQSVEERFCVKAKRLMDTKNIKYSFSLDQNDILQLIDNISKISSDEDFEYMKCMKCMNIIYDNKYDRFKIYEEGDWKEWLKVIGLQKIIHYLKEHYLDSYEVYLIRRQKSSEVSAVHRAHSKELLLKYYKFLGVFDIEPFVKGKSNNKMLYSSNDPLYDIAYEPHFLEHFTIEDELYPIYVKTRDNITKSEINDLKKTIMDILKRNSNKSIEQLNKKVTELFNMDEQFKCVMNDTSNPL